MNDGIAKSLCSLSYISVDDIASVVLKWVAKHKGVRFLEHYLDDFIVLIRRENR